MVYVSVLIAISGCLLFPFINEFSDQWAIIAIAITSRILSGVGNAIALSCLYSLIPILYPETQETKLGWMESACAIGQIVSPSIGSYLYNQGGIFLPYIVISALFIVCLCGLKNLSETKASALKQSIKFSEIWLSYKLVGLVCMSLVVQVNYNVYESTLS